MRLYHSPHKEVHMRLYHSPHKEVNMSLYHSPHKEVNMSMEIFTRELHTKKQNKLHLYEHHSQKTKCSGLGWHSSHV